MEIVDRIEGKFICSRIASKEYVESALDDAQLCTKGLRGLKSQKYYDMVERLRKKSQQKVNVVQKLLPRLPDQVPR